MRQDSAINPVLTRSILYLIFAVSPMYVLTLQIIGMLGAARYNDLIWIACWMAMGATLFLQRARRAPGPDRTGGSVLRMIHGAVAMCLLLGFLIAHLANHDLAIWSVKLHRVAMEWLRLWYRSEWLEPVLLTLFAVMIATGVPMVVQHSRRGADAFRITQMATGVYLGLFLCAHVVAVLGARSAGIETDWRFATGDNGLLDGRGMLIPYYIYATFFMSLHVGCGLRIVLVKHGVAETIANRAVYTVAGAGAIVTMLIAIAAFGFHVKSS
jgi:succinate dehydrogenase/fumarate reductase cytochrome b subunit